MGWDKKFRGGNKGGRRGGRSGGGRFGGGFSDRKEMYDAICSNCGRECRVPFEPTGSKPVYCSDCFEQFGGNDRGERGDRGGRRREDREFKKDRFFDQPAKSVSPEQFEQLNKKLDKILDILSKAVPRETSDDQDSYQFEERKTVRTQNDEPISLE